MKWALIIIVGTLNGGVAITTVPMQDQVTCNLAVVDANKAVTKIAYGGAFCVRTAYQ